jgi:hypothetical protein
MLTEVALDSVVIQEGVVNVQQKHNVVSLIHGPSPSVRDPQDVRKITRLSSSVDWSIGFLSETAFAFCACASS